MTLWLVVGGIVAAVILGGAVIFGALCYGVAMLDSERNY